MRDFALAKDFPIYLFIFLSILLFLFTSFLKVYNGPTIEYLAIPDYFISGAFK